MTLLATSHHPAMPGTSPATAVMDTNRPALARLVNYWLGGKDHLAADRTLGDQITRVHPGIPHGYRAARQAAARTVAALATDGIRQFVDLGTGLPTPDRTDTHTIAQHTAPTSTTLYVDHDPLVLAHCRALHLSDPAGSVVVVDADLTDAAHLTATVATRVDLSAPVAVLATSVAHHLDDPHLHDLVTQLTRRLPAGSRIVVTTHTTRRGDDRLRQVQHLLTQAGIPYHRRTPAQIAVLLRGCGLTLSPPAIPPSGWAPPAPDEPADDDTHEVLTDVQIGRIDTTHRQQRTNPPHRDRPQGAVDAPR
ncbi:SAM-dependent methyltransferase [Micromonospora sp. LOL_023]|uniref:SAM-dependent methyltransferase n=1 Tax=Micromonospora sp. LOL_023 TaxID=3345418 RepID=UPI003A846B7B